jgi:3-methyl-2-oxobutanoate hydroxymethyltransferase
VSKQVQNARITVPEIRTRKGSEKIVCLTAYTSRMAELLDAHCDILLVGDSVGMVLHGLPSPIGVTLDMMLLHGKAVMRGSRRALVVVDLPFGSYEHGPDHAFRTASKVMKKTGCQAVKVEAAEGVAESISSSFPEEFRLWGMSAFVPKPAMWMVDSRQKDGQPTRENAFWPKPVLWTLQERSRS